MLSPAGDVQIYKRQVVLDFVNVQDYIQCCTWTCNSWFLYGRLVLIVPSPDHCFLLHFLPF